MAKLRAATTLFDSPPYPKWLCRTRVMGRSLCDPFTGVRRSLQEERGGQVAKAVSATWLGVAASSSLAGRAIARRELDKPYSKLEENT